MIGKVKSFKNRAELVDFVTKLNIDIGASEDNIQSIVNYPSYRWTQENYNAVLKDIQDNMDLIDKYNDLLNNKNKIWDIYKEELKELRKIDFTPKQEN